MNDTICIARIDDSKSWYECGCLKCGKTVKVLPEQNYTPPSDWQPVELNDNYGNIFKKGYMCPNCFTEWNEPITFSVEVNGQTVVPMQTVDRFKTKGTNL